MKKCNILNKSESTVSGGSDAQMFMLDLSANRERKAWRYGRHSRGKIQQKKKKRRK